VRPSLKLLPVQPSGVELNFLERRIVEDAKDHPSPRS
jgi:hypothetical protein